MTARLDDIDREIINRLQGGFPVSERPYADAAAELEIEEGELMSRIDGLLDDGTLSRFGPMYHAKRMGGGLRPEAIICSRSFSLQQQIPLRQNHIDCPRRRDTPHLSQVRPRKLLVPKTPA